MHLLVILVFGILLCTLLYWHSQEYCAIARELGTRKQLSERISRTRNPYTRNQLTWLEYRMAKAYVRHGSTAAPQVYLPERLARTWYDNSSPVLTSTALAVSGLAMLVAMRLVLRAATEDPILILLGVLVFALAVLVAVILLIQYSSPDSKLRRRVYALSRLDAESRWDQLIAMASSEVASEDGCRRS